MFRLKRLYLYILQTFIPVFFMTFVICLFIIMMQFIWKYVEDLVGKGLETQVLGELFFYVALTLVPMALPLAILLASLMAFGNMGEKLELLATKAAGVSLIRAMRPLIVFIFLVSMGAFLFQNNIIPKVQVKFKALMISIRQKSPELEIPENTFYSGIDNYNLFVKSKNKDTGMLYDVMIYDTSKGFDNMAVIVCDSAKMKMASTKDYLQLNLYHGQQFANFQRQGMIRKQGTYNNDFVPYSRENFSSKQVVIPFDAGFSRMDEASMDNSQISKNVYELKSSIDSLRGLVDSMNIRDREFMLKHTYLSYRFRVPATDSVYNAKSSDIPNRYDLDSIINTLSNRDRVTLYEQALMQAENSKNDFLFRSLSRQEAEKSMRRHDVELQRKFVLSFACLVFFFIGAPLGAIIRKGGLGMPVVISVALFIVYYIIDNIGYKMARDGVWPVWQGVWLSSFILFPLGLFITYKAINDSALFNPEAYGKYLRRILFIKTSQKQTEQEQNEILDKIPDPKNLNIDVEALHGLDLMESDMLRDIVENYAKFNYGRNMRLAALSVLKYRGADISSIINQQDHKYAESNIIFYKKSAILVIVAYFLLMISCLVHLMDELFTFVYVFYSILYIRSVIYYFRFFGKMDKKKTAFHVLCTILSFFLYPFMYLFTINRMRKHIDKIRILFEE